MSRVCALMFRERKCKIQITSKQNLSCAKERHFLKRCITWTILPADTEVEKDLLSLSAALGLRLHFRPQGSVILPDSSLEKLSGTFQGTFQGKKLASTHLKPTTWVITLYPQREPFDLSPKKIKQLLSKLGPDMFLICPEHPKLLI